MPPTGECEALFDYESDNLGDLTFAAGEKIVITEWVGDEWLTGRIGEERNGMFPLSFVKITKELPKDSMSKGTGKFILSFVCTFCPFFYSSHLFSPSCCSKVSEEG